VANFSIEDGVTTVAISPDNRFVAAGSLDKSVRVWDIQSGQLVVRLEGEQGHKDSVYSVAFAPSGDRLVSGSLDKTIKMWELTTSSRFMPAHGPSGKCVRTFEGHKDFVLSVALTPHGDWVLSGSKDRGVQFWDPHTGVAQLMLQGHKNSGMLNMSSFINTDLTLRSHLCSSQPNWRCFRDGQRRHARPYLEVSQLVPLPTPQTLYRGTPSDIKAGDAADVCISSELLRPLYIAIVAVCCVG
jgi:WD40 repeat protein